MKRTRSALLVFVAALAFGTGCAKPDWIQQTLVTVDVTGVWAGVVQAVGGTSFRLELEQQGPKVSGVWRRVGAGVAGASTAASSLSIEGTVAGDVFTFEQVGGPLKGELTVAGDEMAGYVTTTSRSRVSLHRISESLRPASQP